MNARQPEPGCLFLVVGPSGVGKDSLLAAACDYFQGNPDIRFPQRVITRPAESGGEDHCPADEESFARQKAAGKFVLDWQAHGLSYGIPVSVMSDLQAGCSIVVNVSRTVIDAARESFRRVVVLSVTADPEILAARLESRQRSSDGDLVARLARAALMNPVGPDVVTIDNSGSLEIAATAFIGAIAGQGKATEQAEPGAGFRFCED